MKRTAVLLIAGGFLLGASALAQTPTNSPAQGSQQRPDAKYPHPSGQDSQPSTTAPKRASGSAPDKGDPELRGSRIENQPAPVRETAKQGVYQGKQGKKTDPGTACSTARPRPNGGVDCGTSGNGATPGKIPK
jgi:hypothetical protein